MNAIRHGYGEGIRTLITNKLVCLLGGATHRKEKGQRLQQLGL